MRRRLSQLLAEMDETIGCIHYVGIPPDAEVEVLNDIVRWRGRIAALISELQKGDLDDQ